MPQATREEIDRSDVLRERVLRIMREPNGPTRRQLADEALQVVRILGLEMWGGGTSSSAPIELADMSLKTLLDGRAMLSRNLDRWEAVLAERDRLAAPPAHVPDAPASARPVPQPEPPHVPEPEPEPDEPEEHEVSLVVRDEPRSAEVLDDTVVVPVPYMVEFMQESIERAEERARRSDELAIELRATLDSAEELIAQTRELVAGPRQEYVQSLMDRMKIAQADEHSELADRIERALGIAS